MFTHITLDNNIAGISLSTTYEYLRNISSSSVSLRLRSLHDAYRREIAFVSCASGCYCRQMFCDSAQFWEFCSSLFTYQKLSRGVYVECSDSALVFVMECIEYRYPYSYRRSTSCNALLQCISIFYYPK